MTMNSLPGSSCGGNGDIDDCGDDDDDDDDNNNSDDNDNDDDNDSENYDSNQPYLRGHRLHVFGQSNGTELYLTHPTASWDPFPHMDGSVKLRQSTGSKHELKGSHNKTVYTCTHVTLFGGSFPRFLQILLITCFTFGCHVMHQEGNPKCQFSCISLL